jgi:VanZ family protein
MSGKSDAHAVRNQTPARQVNPHFLFNALNTIKAVIRRDSEQASQLVQYLSTFFRKNLKRPSEIVTLADEIEHVNAYLQIGTVPVASSGDLDGARRTFASAITRLYSATDSGECHQTRYFSVAGYR